MATDLRQSKIETAAKEGRRVEANLPKIPMDPTERRKRYAELREKLGRSKIKVKGPEGVTPIWALKNNAYEMARLEWMGFHVVKELKDKPRRFDAAGLLEDGTYVLGDVILMEIDTETYLLQKEIELDDFENLRLGIADEFQQKAKEAGTPTFEVTETGQKKFSPVGV